MLHEAGKAQRGGPVPCVLALCSALGLDCRRELRAARQASHLMLSEEDARHAARTLCCPASGCGASKYCAAWAISVCTRLRFALASIWATKQMHIESGWKGLLGRGG